jgi:hypothetical protein
MSRIRRFARPRREAGYVMVVTIIVLPLLLMMVALSVDVAYYYYRGVQIQRAADASALAGVTRMPRFRDADLTARDVARRNGFVDSEDSVVIKTTFPPENNKRFTVTIRDTVTPIFFGKLARSHWDIRRKSTAEYVSNIPLGSVENAIGTGYLTGASPTDGMVAGFVPQNFWLAVSGPCAAKEAGDQISSKWDGNGVNPSKAPANTDINTKGSYLCDAVAGPPQTNDDAQAQLGSLRDAKNAANSGLFPALVANRDHSPQGYNYIVDVPCAPLTPGGSPPPPPCETTLPTGKDLVIQMYDPVFNPDSVQRFVRNKDFGPGAKPDKFGLNVSPVVVAEDLCNAVDVSGCQFPNVNFGANNPRPQDVKLRTEVRVYPPDSTPLDYESDVPMQLSGSSVVTAADSPYVTGTDVGATKRFGSCVRWTDAWTQSNGTVLQPSPQASASAYNTPAAAVTPFVAEPTSWVDVGESSASDCTNLADKWVTVSRILSTDPTMKRGRFRVNVRTIDALNSFGTNSFALRAFFVPSAAAETYSQCTTLSVADPVLSPCASVAGDSTMSVFAAVPAVSRFYMAQLSPAALYRNKQVIVLLWDPGEGGDKLQILRPRRRDPLTNVGEVCDSPGPDDDVVPAANSDYCIQSFDWSVWNPGLTSFSLPLLEPLDTTTAVAMPDVCLSKGEVGKSELIIGGSEDSITGCATSLPVPLKNSRNGYQQRFGADSGRFNDRLVAVNIQIPKDYGCAIGTGIVVSGSFVNCLELDAAHMPQAGWWKVKYIPQKDSSGNYLALTDRTTWAVQLLGDPVHIVTDEDATLGADDD